MSRRQSKASYEQVPTVDPDLVIPTQPFRETNARSWAKQINTWVHSLFWIALAIFVIIYCDLVRVLRIDPRIIRPCIYIATAFMSLLFILVFYLTLYLPLCKKLKIEDYNITHPKHIQAIVIISGCTFIMFCAGIWPVWGWMSILITSSLFMGLIMLSNFVPYYA